MKEPQLKAPNQPIWKGINDQEELSHFYKAKIHHLGLVAAVANTILMALVCKAVGSLTAYSAMQGFDAVIETFDAINIVSYRASVASKKGKKGEDPDFPTFQQAMMSPDSDEWKEAMNAEVKMLMDMKTWSIVPKSEPMSKGKKVIKLIWAFRQKQTPDGCPTKKKARLCVRGDQMVQNVDYFESYSPVVQWSSVRLMLILSIVHGLETHQVDYVNAFAQAALDKDVYIEIPQGLEHANDEHCIFKLHKLLYGMLDAPLMFFELLKNNLEAVGFKQYGEIDPCLFVHKNAICLTYVDDCLWFGKDGKALDALIEEMKRSMDLKVESDDVSAFLGIQFKRRGDTIELTQIGLTDKIIEAVGMAGANSNAVLADSKPLGKDKNGKPFQEDWNYPSVVGMLLYLSGNSRPDIAFAVNQAA